MTKEFTTEQAAIEITKRRGRKISTRRVRAMLEQQKRGKKYKQHFPHAEYRACECGRMAWFIPRKDIESLDEGSKS